MARGSHAVASGFADAAFSISLMCSSTSSRCFRCAASFSFNFLMLTGRYESDICWGSWWLSGDLLFKLVLPDIQIFKDMLPPTE